MKKLNCFGCCNKSSQCCICSETTNKGFNCKICKEGFVCRKCIPRLCESGLCNKCPVCRQENWRKKNTNQTVIIPIKESEIIIIEPVTQSQGEEKTCWNDYIKYGYSKWKPEHHILALAIGLCEFCIVSYCCWRSLCYPRTDRY